MANPKPTPDGKAVLSDLAETTSVPMKDYVAEIRDDVRKKYAVPGLVSVYLSIKGDLGVTQQVEFFQNGCGDELAGILFDHSLSRKIIDVFRLTGGNTWHDIEAYNIGLDYCKDGETNITPELIELLRFIVSGEETCHGTVCG